MAFAAAVLRTVAVLSVFMVYAVNAETLTNASIAKIIRLNSSLSPSDTTPYWLSPSGIFAFGFYPQGNDNGFPIGIWMTTLPQNVVVWSASNEYGPTFPSNATLKLTKKGLLLRTYNNQKGQITEEPVIDFRTEDESSERISRDITSAAIFDSGNFALLRNNNVSDVIWDSFGSPTDTILGGQNLTTDEDQLISTGFGYRLSWRRNGALVLYAPNSFSRRGNSYWDSRTDGGNLCLSNTGVLYFSKNFTVLANGTAGYNQGKISHGTTIIYRATLDDDGIFRLYSHHILSNKSSKVTTRWSILENRCDVKGFCGLNSFCVGEGSKAECLCYPGFAFINASTKRLGCYQNFSEDGCRSDEEERPRVRYNISTLDNMWWGDFPNSVTTMPKKELCSNSCLEDCNCWAALYSNTSCNKYKQPLRYGKRNPNMSATAFLKVVLGKIDSHSQHDGPSSPKKQAENGTVLVLALSLGSVACVCFVFAASSFVIYKHRVYRYKRLFENANVGLAEDFSLQSFSYDELERATDGFREELGRGSFGAVYKGTVESNGGDKTVAVKRLEKAVEEGIRAFQAEMTTIGRTHHRNLVQLLGYCIEGSKKLLVYEFMGNGSLADHLFKASVRPAWKERVRLALDVARGLFYLHEECGVHIIHCNLKPQNILLDDTLTAKISDFGFARLLMPKKAKVSMGVEESTRSYFAPEWQKNALISVKSDIYSFGIVLLEIICCRRSIDVKVSSPDEIALSTWVRDCLMAGELNKLVELDEDVNMRTLERMVKVGILCIQDDPDLRPLMKNVILMLEGTMDIPVPPSSNIS